MGYFKRVKNSNALTHTSELGHEKEVSWVSDILDVIYFLNVPMDEISFGFFINTVSN